MISLLILLYAFLCVVVFLGRFFEVLIGVRPEPLWSLLSKMGVLYALEPLFTVIFVINMNIVWEKVMSTLRAQIFGKLLIQKVKSNLYKLFFTFFIGYLLECVDCLNYHRRYFALVV
jgi:ATP-binding cassette subfamily B (MDR/TAP) protein 8